MSKRFGRNQRRRAREALAAQVEQTDKAHHLAQDRLEQFHYERRQSAEMREFFEHVARRVGEEAFIARGVGAIDIREPGQSLRVDVREEMVMSPRMAGRTTYETHRMMAETLHHLGTRAVRDAFRQEIVFEAYLNGKSAGICLSESLIRRVSKEELTHVIQNSLAPRLAHHLAKALKGKS